MKIIVRTLMGLEPALAKELEELGCTDINILTRAVLCDCDEKQLYRANLELRTAIKVMVPLKEFVVKNEVQLYEAVKSIVWEDIFKVTQTFAIDGVVHSDTFKHSLYAALKSKDAIADRFRELTDKRPFVNPVNPDISIVIHIRQNTLTVLLDSTGSSLHMRGYRVYPVEAPINEVLAAGMLMLADWDKKTPLLDPMCGSGTFIIEAAMMAANIPAQSYDRKYCFMNWGDFKPELWKQVVEESRQNVNLDAIPSLIGYDKSLKCVSASRTNADEIGVSHKINFDRKDFFTSPGMSNIFLITNPPYDQRLKEDDIIQFYKSIGDKLKKDYLNTQAWIIGGNIEALKNVGLKASKKINLLNGDLESGFHKFEIYEGSKKTTV
jgi:putative N6-adenine-specific DNA methylase